MAIQISSTAVASADITDGTIVNADINASAAIAESKISGLTTDLAAKIPASLVDAKGDLIVATAADTVDRFAVGTDGYALVADSTQTSGMTWRLSAGGSDLLAVGETVPPRFAGSSAGVPSSTGTLFFSAFTARRTESIGTLAAITGSTAAAATPTLCRYGVYQIATNGDMTLVASTTNDTSLFATLNTSAPKALTSTWSKVAGTRYAIGILVVTGAAAPTFHGVFQSGAGWVTELARLPYLTGKVTGQSDLPSSVAVASVATFGAAVYVAMY